jgi:hypothetical protein
MPDPDGPRGAPAANRASIDIDTLIETPTWLPLASAPDGAVRLIRLTAADYRAASFLDARILQGSPPQAECSVTTLAAAAARLAPNAQFIFHIGHVGSTLLSRLAGEHPNLFSLREPTLLREAARAAANAANGLTLPERLGLLSRTWRSEQRALIKATSVVNEIAADLLACTADSRAILVYTPAVTYLRAILAGPNSRLETRALGPSRLERLRRRARGALPEPRHEGEWVAMSWLCEMAALEETATRFGSRVRWMNFERFLLEPDTRLAEMLHAVGVEPDTRLIETVLSGPLLHRYSKAPEHGYDPELRRRVLAEADREHAAEIRAGMDWLAGQRNMHPLISAALAR